VEAATAWVLSIALFWINNDNPYPAAINAISAMMIWPINGSIVK